MAGFIPKDFIQDLVARADVVSVVDSRVRLKKAGRNYQACCPFHNEKTPSFSVAPDKQFYHCFGCGAHGNALDFIMEFDGLEFPDAVEELASMLGLEVPREQRPGTKPGRDRAEIEDDFELMEKCARFFSNQLREHPNRERVVEYLKGRGLSGEIVRDFGIGYAPEQWDAVLREFGRTPDLQKQLLALKMITENDRGKRFDFFRDRIMFPIRDRRGRVVGFGGRVLDKGEPKYLNSPETRLFHKGRELYGFFEMRQKHRDLDRVIIVEGYMDVVALAQFGVTNAVAALGTAATSDHLQLLFRQAKQVICCFDGDRAGRDAAWRALENALPLLRDGTDLQFLFLPDGEDPDTIVRAEGAEGFQQRLDNAQSFREYFFDHLTEQLDLRTDAGKAELVGQAKQLIGKVASDFYRDLLTETLAHRLGRTTSEIERLLPAKEQTASRKDAPKRDKMTPVSRAIGLLIQHPQLGQLVPVHEELGQLNLPGMKVFMALHRQTAAQGLTSAQALEEWRGTKFEARLRELATWDHQVHEENLENEFSETYRYLIDRYLEQRYEELKALPAAELTRERLQELNELLRLMKRK
ncbi:DNA primase [Aliidiomarina haloalkalitolerans]|uniref:DNA primase n=1 Tax=Aliidiomarina haloalkalitolerans TaxID=859059 RepID=A0A432VTQ3_9GAMM|nr:DNA primase [Aliidiomarina haloalkalitolerans]RUO19813.1 DNA primase [Aliidiomarina haloalkalitolerans]